MQEVSRTLPRQVSAVRFLQQVVVRLPQGAFVLHRVRAIAARHMDFNDGYSFMQIYELIIFMLRIKNCTAERIRGRQSCRCQFMFRFGLEAELCWSYSSLIRWHANEPPFGPLCQRSGRVSLNSRSELFARLNMTSRMNK